MNARPLTLDDIADQRAYERERDDFRRAVIAAQEAPPDQRRAGRHPDLREPDDHALPDPGDGPGGTDDHRRADPARARRLQPPAPGPGELSATLFLELTSEEELRTWLPRLVGIERSVVLEIGEGRRRHLVAFGARARAREPADPRGLTSAVHYVRFPLTPEEVAAFGAGPVTLLVDHPEYPRGATRRGAVRRHPGRPATSPGPRRPGWRLLAPELRVAAGRARRRCPRGSRRCP